MNLQHSAKIGSIVEAIESNAQQWSERVACTFLTDGEQQSQDLTFGQLDDRARALAAILKEFGAVGERVLLTLPSGLEFVTSFFGCLYAGAVAIPFYPPRSPRHNSHLHGIIRQAQPKVVVTTGAVRARIDSDNVLSGQHTLFVDEIRWDGCSRWRNDSHEGEDLAYLQYTSGSTRQPRGVTIRHDQLMHNLRAIWRSMEQGEDSLIVSWLPLFHDMGLVGTLLTPLVFGCRSILMSPGHFLQKPLRWLDCMSRHRATSTGAPNFAYDLCVERTTPDQRAQLDLGNWSLAFNGAEPVQPATLDRFCTAFAGSGFRREAFYPCYGLAEATLLVSGGQKFAAPVIRSFHRDALNGGRALESADADKNVVRLTGCGCRVGKLHVEIVDCKTLTPCAAAQVGEIWVAGPGVSEGYWNDPQESATTFGAALLGSALRFLRTGDLGFLLDGELFVTGRLKDILIVRGQNYYAHDIEFVAQSSYVGLATNAGSVFTVPGPDDGTPLLVYVQEVPPGFQKANAGKVPAAIRAGVAAEFGVTLDRILIVAFGRIPRTTSGKTRREACRELYLQGLLRPLSEMCFGAVPQGAAPARN